MKFWHILEKQENDVRKAAKDVQEDLCPFDLSDEDAVQMEERSQRIERVLELVQKKVRRLKQQVKDRKFRHNPEGLMEKVVSCSQYSLLHLKRWRVRVRVILEQQTKRGMLISSRDLVSTEPSHLIRMCYKTRRKRVCDKRKILSQWAQEEGVSEIKLLGYLMYLETFLKHKMLCNLTEVV